MGPEILHALLWLLRTSVRCGRVPVHAAHGYADPAYRPPRLPYASVIGPLMVDIEPQRDARVPPVVLFQLPGHVLGHARAAGQVVPAGGLRLRFDGDALVTVRGVAGATLSTPADAVSLARSIEQALIAAVQAGQALDPAGNPVTPARQAELVDLTVRWDDGARRFAISSGRRGVVDGPRRSSVEVLPLGAGPDADIAPALGLSDAAPIEGRLYRHQLSVPRAMMLDVRLELWAASQLELASLIDDLNRRLPGRGSVITSPALLAADGAPGATTIRLLPEGEPIGRHAWLQLEAADSVGDRVNGRPFSATGALDHTPDRFHFDGASKALTAVISPLPLIPSPLDPPHPAPRGLALAVGVTLPAGTAGQSARLCALEYRGSPVLRLDVAFVSDNGGPVLAEIKATATFQQSGGATAAAVSRWRVSADRLAQRSALHAAVVASHGIVELSLDGQPQPDDALVATPPAVASGLPFAGNDMTLTLGDPAGNALPFDLAWVQLSAEPVGAADPRLRRSLAAASRWPAGRRLTLAVTEDGRSPGKVRQEVTVVSVEGDVLTIAPPLLGSWPRGRTILFAEENFVQQQHLRRKDDLLNHLYRATGEYRVSAMLDDDVVGSAAPVAEIAEIELYAAPPNQAAREAAAGTTA